MKLVLYNKSELTIPVNPGVYLYTEEFDILENHNPRYSKYQRIDELRTGVLDMHMRRDNSLLLLVTAEHMDRVKRYQGWDGEMYPKNWRVIEIF